MGPTRGAVKARTPENGAPRPPAPPPVAWSAAFVEALAAARGQRFDEAAQACLRILRERQLPTAVLMDVARLCTKIDRHETALLAIGRAIELEPDNALLFARRGMVEDGIWRIDEAAASFRRAIELHGDRPHHPLIANARFGLCILQLRIVHESEHDVARARRTYEAELDALSAYYERASDDERAAAIRSIDTRTPFLLAYEGHNDVALQRKWGRLMSSLMAAALPHLGAASPPPPPPEPGARIRVGFAAAYFNRHSVWKIPLGGWIRGLDRSRFEVFGYHLSNVNDAVTALARSSCEHLVGGPMPIDRWAERIKGDRLDVLVYPELGMFANAIRLAALRLAPVQCVGLGHPETTGLPTMDYFLSSELMETQDADAHYTERLVRLPNLSVYYEPLDDIAPSPNGRAAFGLREDATVYLSCQLTSKYLPRHDHLYAEIVARVEGSQLIFIDLTRSPAAIAVFRERMKRAFEARGLSFEERCVITPMLEPADFGALARCADVGLDSVAWSGFNTTMETLAVGLPIVTWPQQLCRARHCAAVLTRIGMPETIAESGEAFVDIAVRLGVDAVRRRELSRLGAERIPGAYRDRAVIQALETFFERATRAARGG